MNKNGLQEPDAVKFQRSIAALHAAFGLEATEHAYQAYWIGLEDLSIADVHQAVMRGIRESVHMPRVAELRKYAGIAISAKDRAESAWVDVLRATKLGPYKWIDFQDKVCNAAIRSLGGWPSFLQRLSSAENERWARRDFVRAYEAFSTSRMNADLVAALPGLSDQEVVTGADGKRVLGQPVPRVIACDPSRAKAPILISNESENQRRVAYDAVRVPG